MLLTLALALLAPLDSDPQSNVDETSDGPLSPCVMPFIKQKPKQYTITNGFNDQDEMAFVDWYEIFEMIHCCKTKYFMWNKLLE